MSKRFVTEIWRTAWRAIGSNLIALMAMGLKRHPTMRRNPIQTLRQE